MTKRLSTGIPEELYKKLLALAEADKRSVAAMIAVLVEEAIAAREKKQNE